MRMFYSNSQLYTKIYSYEGKEEEASLLFGVRNVTTHLGKKNKFQQTRELTYGVIECSSAQVVWDMMNPCNDDIVVDLGCGDWKLLTYRAINYNCKNIWGVEIVRERVMAALYAKEELLKHRGKKVADRIQVFHADITNPPEKIMMASHIYMNNELFGEELMICVMKFLQDKCDRLKKILVTRKICHRPTVKGCAVLKCICTKFHAPEKVELNVSWKSAKGMGYLYECKL